MADFDATRHKMALHEAGFSGPPCPECARLRAQRDALLALLHEARQWLDAIQDDPCEGPLPLLKEFKAELDAAIGAARAQNNVSA